MPQKVDDPVYLISQTRIESFRCQKNLMKVMVKVFLRSGHGIALERRFGCPDVAFASRSIAERTQLHFLQFDSAFAAHE